MISSKLPLNLKVIGLTALLAAAVLSDAGCSVESRRGKNASPGDQLDYKMAGGTNFRIDALKVDSTYVVAFQSNGGIGKKLFNFSACIKDIGGNAVLPDLKFAIRDGVGGEIIRPADRGGCIQWAETYEVNSLKSESLILLKRTIAPISIYRGEVYAEAALDPWLDGAASIIDLRKTSLPSNIKIVDVGPLSIKGEALSSKPEVSQALKVYTDSISFQSLGLDFSNFEVNRFLGLTVAQKYRVRFKPTLIRQSLTTEIDTRIINKGRMRVVLTLLKDVKAGLTVNPENVVTSVEFIGDVIYGTVTADLTLKLENISALLSRSLVLVTLEPLDELADVAPQSFIGPSNPGPLSIVSLVPAKENARDMSVAAAQIKAPLDQAREKTTPVQMFIESNGLKSLDTSGEVSLKSGLFSSSLKLSMKEALDRMALGQLDEGQQAALAKALCYRKYRALFARDFCFYFTNKAVSLVRREFVESVNNKVPTLVGQTNKETLSFSTGVDYGTAVSDGGVDSMKWGWAAGLGLDVGSSWPPEEGSVMSGLSMPVGASLKGSLGAKIGVGQDWFKTTTRAKNVSVKAATTTSKSIDVISNSFVVDVNYRPCVIFAFQASMPSFGGVPPDTTQYYYCTSQLYQKKARESFYLLNEKVGDDSTGFSDSGSPGASPWRMFIRGPQTYLLFSKMVQSLKAEDLILEKLPEAKDMQSKMRQFPEFYMMQEYPGMLTN